MGTAADTYKRLGLSGEIATEPFPLSARLPR